jgi:hypothetical protein
MRGSPISGPLSSAGSSLKKLDGSKERMSRICSSTMWKLLSSHSAAGVIELCLSTAAAIAS